MRRFGVTIVAVGTQQWIFLLFSRYITNGTVVWKKIEDSSWCFDFLYNFCLKISEKKIQRGIINVIDLHVKYSLFLWDFDQTWIFWADIRKILKYKISRNSVPLEQSCSKRTDRHDEAYVVVTNIANCHNSALTYLLTLACLTKE